MARAASAAALFRLRERGHTRVGVSAPDIGELVEELRLSLILSFNINELLFYFIFHAVWCFVSSGRSPLPPVPVPPPIIEYFRGAGVVCLAYTVPW